ncbi:MAG: PhzF family phenazine biosynthesis protein [Candidatus Latescibacterota bacterium]|nr:MAG: PhzF family phenazine biosynthesis protein [Candidatus Latescibacterota bacterium]
MPNYPFMQVDAFTAEPLAGNACAILFDTDDLDADTMLAVAREQNLSETSFVRRSEVADFGARYFTPAEEVPLAGHPTIATVFALVDSGRLKLEKPRTTMTLELQVGPIEVEIVTPSGRVEQVIMSQKKPEFMAEHAPTDVVPAFGLEASDVLPDGPIQVVSTGTPQLMVPLRDIECVRRAALDWQAYADLRRRGGFFSAHLFCLQGITHGGQTFARHYAIPPDLIEDPFTGSATGGMGAYLWHHGLIENPRFVAEQGHGMRRPGHAQVEVVGPREDIETVRVGGAAVVVLRGEMTL